MFATTTKPLTKNRIANTPDSDAIITTTPFRIRIGEQRIDMISEAGAYKLAAIIEGETGIDSSCGIEMDIIEIDADGRGICKFAPIGNPIGD